MNTIEAMRQVVIYACDYLDILPGSADNEPNIVAVREMLEAYDALVPEPDDWPADMNWFAIDGNGRAHWYPDEPTIDRSWCEWENDIAEEAGHYALWPGVDWRLCKWAKPEVQ